MLDEITLPTRAIANEDATINRQRIEGTVTHIDYRMKPATAPLQIERHYTDLLGGTGFKTILLRRADLRPRHGKPDRQFRQGRIGRVRRRAVQ